jgi:hypothetical protein
MGIQVLRAVSATTTRDANLRTGRAEVFVMVKLLALVAVVLSTTNIASAQTAPVACPPLKEVVSAVWFNGANKADVTAKVRELVAAGQYKFEARNNILGADPAAGVSKQLTVTYVDVSGKSVTKTVAERQVFELPAVTTPVRDVVSATWFNGARKADVTAKVKELVAAGQYKIEARNHILGADPAVGVSKQLTVTYVNGKCAQVTKTVAERQFFEF